MLEPPGLLKEKLDDPLRHGLVRRIVLSTIAPVLLDKGQVASS
jgi:hypothetical protein